MIPTKDSIPFLKYEQCASDCMAADPIDCNASRKSNTDNSEGKDECQCALCHSQDVADDS